MVFPKILIKSLIIAIICLNLSCKSQTNKEKSEGSLTGFVPAVQPKKAIDCVTNNNKIPKIKSKKRINYPKYLNKDYVLGKFNYTKNKDFSPVPKKISSKNIYLRNEVLKAFQLMADAAKKDGITLKVISGTRNYTHQKGIWDYKWNSKYKTTPIEKRALKILEYSSMPSTSRHHWGTDLDINNLENSYFAKGKGKKEYDWLVKNGPSYGFIQVYTSKDNGRTGYNEEKWHWSYAPLSSIYLEFYNTYITNKDITGFKGFRYAEKIDMVKNYVNGININLLNYKRN